MHVTAAAAGVKKKILKNIFFRMVFDPALEKSHAPLLLPKLKCFWKVKAQRRFDDPRQSCI
jgi:hypothetical protein